MEPTDRLTVTLTSSPLEIVCVCAGDIDPESAPRLEGELRAALFTSTAPSLVLDLTDVSFMDSSGLRVVIDLHKTMRERSGRLILRKPSPTVSRLLEVTNLTGTLDIEE